MNEQKNTTKTQIKQAAIRQIEKFGIDKTSMRSIAAEANMTTGAIYYYYKNKQKLGFVSNAFRKKNYTYFYYQMR